MVPSGSSRRNRPRLVLLALSAYNRDEIIARAIYAGAVDYMVKPFSPTELVARVRGALRRGLPAGLVEPSESFVLGDLTLDYAGRAVSVACETVVKPQSTERMSAAGC